MKFVEENNEKMFTKNLGKDIIRKKYNPSNEKNIFHEREGLLMKEENDIIKDIALEISRKYNKKEKIIRIMFGKCDNLGYTFKESKDLIKRFFEEN